jgi:hypothetical protein
MIASIWAPGTCIFFGHQLGSSRSIELYLLFVLREAVSYSDNFPWLFLKTRPEIVLKSSGSKVCNYPRALLPLH